MIFFPNNNLPLIYKQIRFIYKKYVPRMTPNIQLPISVALPNIPTVLF